MTANTLNKNTNKKNKQYLQMDLLIKNLKNHQYQLTDFNSYSIPLNCLLQNIIKNLSIKKEAFYKDNNEELFIKNYLFEFFLGKNPTAALDYTYITPYLKDPAIIKRINRFVKHFNNVIYSQHFEKFVTEEYEIVLFGEEKVHAELRLLDYLINKELFPNCSDNQIFLSPSKKPCLFCFLILSKYIAQIGLKYPLRFPEETSEEIFNATTPYFLDEDNKGRLMKEFDQLKKDKEEDRQKKKNDNNKSVCNEKSMNFSISLVDLKSDNPEIIQKLILENFKNNVKKILTKFPLANEMMNIIKGFSPEI
jgi:hypothetical protein